jgi:hypothetical protein
MEHRLSLSRRSENPCRIDKYYMDYRTSDLTGQTFGQWTVLRFDKYDKRNAFWWCRCACGLEKSVKAQYLKGGESTKCTDCAKKPRDWQEMPQSRWYRIVRNAGKRDIPLMITREQAFELYLQQNKQCALSGVPLKLDGSLSCTASLDRISSDKGYEPGNIQWVHKDVNIMKNVFDEQYFIDLCQKIVTRRGNPRS